MPSITHKQQRFMRAELGRKRAGKPTKTSMTEEQLEHFASSVRGSGTFKVPEINRGYRKL